MFETGRPVVYMQCEVYLFVNIWKVQLFMNTISNMYVYFYNTYL